MCLYIRLKLINVPEKKGQKKIRSLKFMVVYNRNDDLKISVIRYKLPLTHPGKVYAWFKIEQTAVLGEKMSIFKRILDIY